MIQLSVSLTHFVCCLSHELLGWLSPNGRNCNYPSYVVVDDSGGRLVGQLLQAMILEELQCMGKHDQRKHLLAICRLNLNTLVQVLGEVFVCELKEERES